MLHVLGVKLGAAQRAGRGDDGAVPVRKAVCRRYLQRCGHDLQGDRLYPKPRPGRDQPGGDVVRQPIGAGRPCCLDIEFLEHLYRERSAIAVEQFERPLPLCRLVGGAADRVQQDIGVEEMQP